MSYSMQEPDWPIECECTYDETRDEMNREDCLQHYNLDDHVPVSQSEMAERKPPSSETRPEGLRSKVSRGARSQNSL